jgi:carbamoylphosphate synthase small subunit
MMTRFEAFARRVDDLCRRHGNKDLKEWFDGQEVCLILGVTKRTLQTLRDNGALPYTMIAHKVWYRPQDVQNLLGRMAVRKGVRHE